MKYKEYVIEFNKGVHIHEGRVLENGGEAGINHRIACINRYVGTFMRIDVVVGVKPFSVVENDIFKIRFGVNILVRNDNSMPNKSAHKDKYVATALQPTKEQEEYKAFISRMCDDIMEGDMDIDVTFKEFGFTPYYKED